MKTMFQKQSPLWRSVLLMFACMVFLLTGCPSGDGGGDGNGAQNQAPAAHLTASVTQGEAPLEVMFDGSASSDPDGDALSFNWNFGDGTPAVSGGDTASHTYATPGDYTAVLTVTDPQHESDTAEIDITVSTAEPQQVSVPDVTGLAQAAAEASIAAAGLVVGSVTTENSDTVAAGNVIRQDPAASTAVDEGSAVSLVVSLGPDAALPPDPADVATPLSTTAMTSLAEATAFLYTGSDPIQTGVEADTIQAERAAVIRGKVISANGDPLSGVTVTFLHHPELGQTLSRTDGYYDLAANGGGVMVLQYQKSGYLTVQRRRDMPWQNYTVVDDVAMTPLDTAVTTIDMGSAGMQSARGSVMTDDQGTRQATLLFEAGTQAQLVMPDGSTQAAGSLKVRATEYTVGENGPAAMPAELPNTTAYTYCVDLTADEAIAAGAKRVDFSQPVFFYVEDLYGFPVGSAVPTGYYDRSSGEWKGSANGRVVKLLSISAGLANLDTNGDDVADDASVLGALGVTTAERQELAALYPSPPKQFWRVPVQHFTPFDCNFPYVPPDDAEKPDRPEPEKPDPEDDPCEESGSSIIACQNQALGESVPVAGTDFKLVYWSDRADSDGYWVDISLTGASVPASLKRVVLRITAGGRRFDYAFEAFPNLSYTFFWDGIDAYGRKLRGSQSIEVKIGYVYQCVYCPVEAEWADAWARVYGMMAAGGGVTVFRQSLEVTLWQSFWVTVSNYSFSSNAWELNIHHLYDATERVLYKGDGGRRSAESFSARVIHPFAGNGTGGYSGDGGPAVDAQLKDPYSATAAPDGTLYIADFGNHAIRRVDREGMISTVAGDGTLCDALYGDTNCGEGGPAISAGLNFPTGVAFGPDGSWYISDAENRRIRKVDADGIITTFAGGGDDASDGIPATEAQLGYVYGKVAVASDGSVFIPDCSGFECRIRKVDPAGKIWTVLEPDYGGDTLTLGPDGAIFFSGDNEVYRLTTNGVLATVAGNGTPGYSGDGGPAVDAELRRPMGISVARDGGFYFAERTNYLLRHVNNEGYIYTLAGTGATGGIEDGLSSARATFDNPIDVTLGQAGEIYVTDEDDHLVAKIGSDFPGFSTGVYQVPDGGLLCHFDRNGRHLSTTSALTGALVYEFLYDGEGRLTTIRDLSGNETILGYDANGDLASITAPFGQVTAIEVDDSGRIATVTYPSGSGHAFTYAANGLMLSRTDPNGHLYSYTYDEKGFLKSATSPLAAEKTLERTVLPSGYSVTVTSPENRIQTFRVEDLPAGGRRISNTRGCCGEIVLDTFPDGESRLLYEDGTQVDTIYAPDIRWGLQTPIPATTTITTPDGLTLTQTVEQHAAFAEPGNPLTLVSYERLTTVNGRLYQTAYDAALRKLTGTSPEGRQLTRYANEDGFINRFEFGGLAERSIDYDDKGRPVTFSLGSGDDARQYTVSYNAHGEVSGIADPLTRSMSFSYDNDGRLTEVAYPGTSTLSLDYDANGNLTAITPPGRPAHQFAYSDVNQLSAYILPDTGSGSTQVQYAYDLDGRLVSIQRPGGATTSMTYGDNGEIATASAGTALIAFTYDPGTGKLIQVNGPAGETVRYQHDGRLNTGETVSGTLNASVGYTYDNNLNRTGVLINGSQVCNFVYDDDSLLVQAGGLTLVRDPANGLVTATTLGNVTTGYTYNAFGEVTGMGASIGGGSVYAAVYTRDKLGRIVEKIETVDTDTHTYAYTYDVAGNLSSVSRDAALLESFSYDGNGNLVSYTGGGDTATGVYDNQDRILTFGDAAFTHTLNGERLSRTIDSALTEYHYDGFGDLSGATLSDGTLIEYLADGRGRRIARKENGGVVQRLLYSGDLRPIAELDDNGNPVRTFIYASRANVPDFMIMNATPYRIIADPVGSIRMVINSVSGEIVQTLTYSAFGGLESDSNPGFQPFGFAGGLYDPDTGLVRFGARDYDPATARWMVKDPILFMGDVANLYRYVHNDPVNRYDMNGLGEDDAWFDTEEPWSQEDCDQWMNDECKKGNENAQNKYSYCYDIAKNWNKWKELPFFKDYEGLGFEIKRQFQEAAINANQTLETPEQKQEAADKWKQKVWDDFHAWKTNRLFWNAALSMI